MLTSLLRFKKESQKHQPTSSPIPSLSGKEIAEFVDLLDRVENERLWNGPLYVAVGDYMFRTGISYAELMNRYEAVCPEYRKKDFPLRDGLRNVGEFIEGRRRRLSVKIYKNAGTPGFDPKEVILTEYKEYCEAVAYI